MKNIILFSLFALFLISVSACSNNSNTPPDGAEEFIQGLIERNKIPGLAVAVSIKGEVVWIKGFGYAELELKVPVNPELTKFRIASISKPLTTSGLAVLKEKGEIDFEAPIQDYVPYFPQKAYPVTVRQIAGHIGGIRGYRGQEIYSKKRFRSVKKGVEIFSLDSLIFKPGEKYAYSTLGFSLLAAAIEEVSGTSFLEFMNSNVFQPIDMHSTVVDWTDSLILNRAAAYVNDKGIIENARYLDHSYKWAGGGYLSTATDLVKFGNAILSNKLFSEEIKKILISPQQTSDGLSTGYGMGWYIDTTESGIPYYGHNGGGIGGKSSFNIYPDHELVVVILTNSTNGNFSGIHEFAELFMD